MKGEVLVRHRTTKSEDLLLSEDWKGHREKKEKKRTLEDNSCKVLNLTFVFGCF